MALATSSAQGQGGHSEVKTGTGGAQWGEGRDRRGTVGWRQGQEGHSEVKTGTREAQGGEGWISAFWNAAGDAPWLAH